MRKYWQHFFGYAFLLFALAACSNPTEPGGVVARVNGQSISLQELQARYDMDHFNWSDNSLPQAEELQRQYGDSLSALIVNALVMQTLEKKDLAVTDAELQAAEQEVRGDYPAGEFETMLEEDAIDLDLWRRFLRQRLAVQKFTQHVLRPELKVSIDEVTKHYNANKDKFLIPGRLHFLIVESLNREDLNAALEDYKRRGKVDVFKGLASVYARQVRMHENRLSPQWLRELKSLKDGETSLIKPSEEGFQFIVLLEKQPEKPLALAQAYPLVEKELLEKKQEQAFETWVGDQLKKADIEISEDLLKIWPGKAGKVNATSPASPQSIDNLGEDNLVDDIDTNSSMQEGEFGQPDVEPNDAAGTL